MHKIVIALWHSGGKGKTGSLREFAHLLLRTYPTATILLAEPNPVPTDRDFRLVVEIKGKIIAIESQGDPNTNLHGRLMKLVATYNPDIILCSSRTKGDTVWSINQLALSPLLYEIIWTSTYQTKVATMHNTFNQLKAKHLLDFLLSLGLI